MDFTRAAEQADGAGFQVFNEEQQTLWLLSWTCFHSQLLQLAEVKDLGNVPLRTIVFETDRQSPVWKCLSVKMGPLKDWVKSWNSSIYGQTLQSCSLKSEKKTWSVCMSSPALLLWRKQERKKLDIEVQTRLQGAVFSIVLTLEPAFNEVRLSPPKTTALLRRKISWESLIVYSEPRWLPEVQDACRAKCSVQENWGNSADTAAEQWKLQLLPNLLFLVFYLQLHFCTF